MNSRDFSDDFIWGAATASYQIEGGDLDDGKKASIWTAFSHTPGKIYQGETGDIGCDHYYRYREDLDLMAKLGLNGYRFSIAWSRVLPDGRGKPNQKGLDFYSRLIDGLLERGITPFITLYHWDLPQELQERIGGWESRDIVNYFGDYASLMFECFGDRAVDWITLNEPLCSSHLSYFQGVHAPGVKDPKRTFNVVHNLLMAHGEGVRRFREICKNGQIGLTNVSSWIEPASESEEDTVAATLQNQLINDWFFLTPLTGKYPEKLSAELGKLGLMPEVLPGDMELISTPFDFWGVNYYTRDVVKADPNSLIGVSSVEKTLETTEMGWEIYPKGLENFLKMTHERYGGKPVYVTENGMADVDRLEDGKIHDEKRIKYLNDHFEASSRAMKAGVDLRGYFVWSLMDNFEWAFGYSKRFGLIYIDYENQQRRIPKDSYYWYRDFLNN